MKIEDKLVASVINGLKALYGQEVPEKMVQLQKTKKEFEGHLTLVVFPFLKMSRKGPEQTAQEIGEYLKANDPAVAAFNVIKGFLNLTIASATWIELLNEIQADELIRIEHFSFTVQTGEITTILVVLGVFKPEREDTVQKFILVQTCQFLEIHTIISIIDWYGQFSSERDVC